MANVVLSCVKCASELGCFRNSWIGIGNSYFSPVYPPVTFLNGFEATGDVFAKGQDGSAVQNSVLQDLACRQCATVVGLRCDDAPAGHLLKKNQLILRLAEMHIVSEQTGEKATISVQQKIPLVAPGTKKAARRAATVQPTPRHQTPVSLNRDVEARPINGTMRPPPQPLPGSDVARFSTWAEDAIRNQQKDIDRISGAVARIEKDMESFKEFMGEMRAELEANRATRKTQQDLNQEQLAWLQEDLKELRQENGDFQQDLREEELPDIRNQLDQLRLEIDSQEQTTGVPNDNRRRASVNEFQREMLDIRRKCGEVDELKAELQRLRKRLNDVEEKRQESFVFPRTLMTPNQSSHTESRMMSMPTIAQQRTRMMLPPPEDHDVQSTMPRHASPTRNPPGAFPESIVDLGLTPRNVTAQAAKTTVVSTSARIHRTIGRREIAGTAELATSKPVITQKWSYTGFRHWKNLKAAFEAFELEYPKLGIPESVKILEDHVNTSSLQSTAPALQHGEVTLIGENNEDVEYRDPSELNHPETSPLKRKHDQVDGTTEGSASEAVKKKRGQSIRAAEKQPTNHDQILRSPSLSSRTTRPDMPEHRVAVIISSDQGSPELGRNSRFRSLHGEPVSSKFAIGVQHTRKRHDGGANVDGRALQAQSNLSNKENKAKPVHRHQRSRDELGVLPPLVDPRTPASRSRNGVSSARANPLLMTIEGDEAAIPGAFPSDLTDPDAAAPTAQLANTKLGAIVFDPRTDTSKHFKCGICGKKYRNPAALKYHKKHSSCDDDPRDANPTKFKCPTCNTELSYGGLVWHLTNDVCGGWAEQEKASNQTTIVDKEQKRRDTLVARERLVKETLEREM